jgi:hypothetical protein
MEHEINALLEAARKKEALGMGPVRLIEGVAGQFRATYPRHVQVKGRVEEHERFASG